MNGQHDTPRPGSCPTLAGGLADGGWFLLWLAGHDDAAMIPVTAPEARAAWAQAADHIGGATLHARRLATGDHGHAEEQVEAEACRSSLRAALALLSGCVAAHGGRAVEPAQGNEQPQDDHPDPTAAKAVEQLPPRVREIEATGWTTPPRCVACREPVGARHRPACVLVKAIDAALADEHAVEDAARDADAERVATATYGPGCPTCGRAAGDGHEQGCISVGGVAPSSVEQLPADPLDTGRNAAYWSCTCGNRTPRHAATAADQLGPCPKCGSALGWSAQGGVTAGE